MLFERAVKQALWVFGRTVFSWILQRTMLTHLVAVAAVAQLAITVAAVDLDTTVKPLYTSLQAITTDGGVCEALRADGECAMSRIVGGQEVCPPFR